MKSILPVISMTDLQRDAKKKLSEVREYAVIQRHGKDVAFVLHPSLGKLLLDSGFLEILKSKGALQKEENSSVQSDVNVQQLDDVIGQVLRELSRK